MGSCNALRVFPTVIKMLEDQQETFAGLASKTYPFGQAAVAFSDWDLRPEQFTRAMIDLRDE